MSHSSSATTAELDDFVSRAEQIHAAVSGLASGKLETEDTSALLKKLEKRTPVPVDPAVEAMRREQREADEEARKRKGIPGQGARPGYLYFCRNCFREYDLEPKPVEDGPSKGKLTCAHCQATLITRDERMVELQAKVAVVSAHKAERAKRRQQFALWKHQKAKQEEQPKMVVLSGREEEKEEATAAAANASLSSKYQDWDLWEPSSDEEAEVPQPDHPEFAAMKADMDARDEKKKLQRIVSDRANEKGNEAIKRKDYLAAVEHYTQAVDATRGEKSFYTNRALALINVFDYARAVKDCDTVINIYECFEAAHTRYTSDYKNMKLVLKAHLRRSRAETALGLLTEARASLTAATGVVQLIYSLPGRREPIHVKAQKDELAEIQKLLAAITEKVGFQQEEKRLQSTSTDSSSSADAVITPAVASGPADTDAITALLTSLTSSHQHMLSSAPPSAGAPAVSWSLFTPALQFLSLTLDSDGNKDRVATQVDSRLNIDVLLKMCKQHKTRTPASNVQSTANLPSTLPDFAAAIALFSSSHPSRASNCIAFREKDGFVLIGKYLSQLFNLVSSHSTSASGLPRETLASATKILMVLTDREHAREYLASAAHAPVVTDLSLELIDDASATQEARLHASNLIANLAFQPRYRQWLCASPEQLASGLDRIYSAVLRQTTSCTLTDGKATGSGQGEVVLSSGLSIVINLLTHQACRLRFIEAGSTAENPSADSSAASSTAPLSLLLSVLEALCAGWSRLSYVVAIGSLLAELSEKILSILMNLAVDEWANVTIFGKLLPSTLKHLVKLAAQPATTSSPTAAAVEVTSTLPPILVERALGVLTRGVRREHTAASAPVASSSTPRAPMPRPLRKILLENDGIAALLRILALHAHATEEEGVSAESVLAKLNAAPTADSAASSSPAPASSSSSFRYTRLTMEHASVCLAVCLSNDPASAAQVVPFSYQGSSGLSILVALLSSKHKNLAGNACLCIDALCSVPSVVSRPELSAALDLLLGILKDPASKAAHQNAAKAAILIGRSPNNAERWTKMRGVEIISTVLKMK